MFPEHLIKQAAEILELCKAKGLKLGCAESCTGGLLAALFTENSGASAVFEGGFLTYSNTMKRDILGVSAESLENFGAVSEQVALEMAERCRQKTSADIAVSITGIAGPTGGTADKPLGLVYVGISTTTHAEVHRHVFTGESHGSEAAITKAGNDDD